MVDNGTWNRLSEAERREFNSYSKRFISAVQKSGTFDGWAFGQEYGVREDSGVYYLARSDDRQPFAGITSKSRAVIDALLTDAVQNYGR